MLLLSGHGMSWSLHEVPVPANGVPGTGTIRDVTCIPASECLAVGAYQVNGGETAGLIVWGYGSNWTATEAPEPAPASLSPSLYSAACAIGDHLRGRRPHPDSWPGRAGIGTWLDLDIHDRFPAIRAVPQSPQGSVACRSSGACLAVVLGHPYGGPGTSGWLESGYGAKWTRVQLPVPAHGVKGSASPLSVACVPGGQCLTAGQYAAPGGQAAALLLTGHGTWWTASMAPLPANGNQAAPSGLGPIFSIYWPIGEPSVSCARSGLCAALGYYTASTGQIQDLLVWGYGSSWTAAGSVPEDASSPDLASVACTSSSATASCAIPAAVFNATDGTMIWGPG